MHYIKITTIVHIHIHVENIVLYLHESDPSSIGNVVVDVVDSVGLALVVGSAALKWSKSNSHLFEIMLVQIYTKNEVQ